MNETLFQYIWQFQYFNTGQLETAIGEPIQIIHPGKLNTNQGPDFEDARIKIGNTTWAGAVELHLKTSDWKKHKHQHDKNYKKVILHVVYTHNDSDNDDDIPVLELRGRISASLFKKYEELMQVQSFIPCKNSIRMVPDLIVDVWKGRLLAERLIRKSSHIETYQQQNNNHWQESFWWALARSFGNPINTAAFEAIAKSIPLSILGKHKGQIHQLEALLLGQAGLLVENFEEAYPIMLKKEYKFLQKKYALQPIHHTVQFLRMRPGNFPTLRLAQLAMLISQSVHLFSKIIEETSVGAIQDSFKIPANDFWNYHYTLTEKTVFKNKMIGDMMVNNIIINTIVPVLFLYGNDTGDEKLKEKAINWLDKLAPEKNVITKGFENLGLNNKSAMDSQAYIELKTQYCSPRKCLRCSIGNYLLKKEK